MLFSVLLCGFLVLLCSKLDALFLVSTSFVLLLTRSRRNSPQWWGQAVVRDDSGGEDKGEQIDKTNSGDEAKVIVWTNMPTQRYC